MEIAPLIHSRTLHCDFNPNFAVRADDVDVNWAMKKILLATSDVDILNGVRRLVASNGKICIAGVACNLRFFSENYLSDSDADDAKNYFHDERGREIKIFLGYSFKGGSKNEIPNVDYSTLWKFFKENLAPEWEHATLETVIAEYKPYSTKSFGDKVNLTNIGGINFVESNSTVDEKLFQQCMTERKNLCTNVDQMKIINSGEFEVLSTSQSLMNRFKSESEKKNSTIAPKSSNQSTSIQSNIPDCSKVLHKDNNSKIQIICAAVIIILVVVFLLMK